MSSKIKWGIIGPGRIAHKFAEALQNVPDAELYAVASRDEASAQSFAQKYNVNCYYGNYNQLVLNPAVDIIYIATPHTFHKEHTLLCLNNKKPVLCEKPLAHKLSDVQSMINASKANQTFLMEAMWTRFLPSTEKVLELIKSGTIGEVKKVTADFGFHSPFDPKGRLYDMSLGGGSLMDVGVYPLFLALTVLGEPSGFKASATLSPTGADEHFHALLNYPNAEAEISSSIVANTKLEAVISGTKGSLSFVSPWYRQTSIVWTNESGLTKEYHFEYPGNNGFEFQIIETMNCLKEGKIESSIMSHSFSLLQSKVLDELCKEVGIVYL